MGVTHVQLTHSAGCRCILGIAATEIDIGYSDQWFYNGRSRQLVDIGIHAEKEVIQ
jgi:hypothetical protein